MIAIPLSFAEAFKQETDLKRETDLVPRRRATIAVREEGGEGVVPQSARSLPCGTKSVSRFNNTSAQESVAILLRVM